MGTLRSALGSACGCKVDRAARYRGQQLSDYSKRGTTGKTPFAIRSNHHSDQCARLAQYRSPIRYGETYDSPQYIFFPLTIIQWLRSCQQSTGCLGCLLRSASTSTISGSTDQFTSKHRWASLVCKLLACMPTAHSRSLCFPFAKHFLWRSQQLEFLSSIEAAAFSALFIACPWCHLSCMSCPAHTL